MFKNIFGKKKSIKRFIVISFTVTVLLTLTISSVIFYKFVHLSVSSQLFEININSNINPDEISSILNTMRRSLIIIICIIIIINIILMRVISKKILQPLTRINEATKEVASGNFTIELETEREDEVGELTKNFNTMVKGLGSIEHLQKDFIDNVSHEIKTPISSIEGFAKLLKDENLSQEERNEFSDIIIEEAGRLTNISTNILKLSKLQNQDKIINKENINISEQLRRTISVLEPKWKEKNLKINVSMQEKFFLGDSDLMSQVWINLIDNAIKFSKSDGEIDIKVKEENNIIIVSIRDYGIGIKEEEKTKIFDRFYQVDKSHSGQGSGLGLAIVKRIIDLSEAKLEVESKENEGTTFIVKLPVTKEKNKIVIK